MSIRPQLRRHSSRQITRESCGFIKLILKKVKKQKSFNQIVEELDLDADFAKPLYDFVLKHIDLSETDIIQKYLEM